jgi:hypothetical protein
MAKWYRGGWILSCPIVLKVVPGGLQKPGSLVAIYTGFSQTRDTESISLVFKDRNMAIKRKGTMCMINAENTVALCDLL